MRQVGRSNLGACQMIDVLEVQIVGAIVEHVDHLMRHDALRCCFVGVVGANHDLVRCGIVAASHRFVAYFTREIPSNVYRAAIGA